MEIRKIDEKELVISQRKKRNRDSKKTIFEIFFIYNFFIV